MHLALSFLNMALGILGLLCFHIDFSIVCSISVKNGIGILIGIVLNLQTALNSKDTLVILILTNYECRVFFHLLGCSSVSFISVL